MLTAYTEVEPVLANMVMRQCSFKLKGPGFIVNDNFVPGMCIAFVGRDAAMNFPKGRTKIWAETEVIERKFWR